MFADQSNEPADSRILQHFSMLDVHALSLAQYRHRMAATNPTHPWVGEDDQTLLRKLGGWRRDRATGLEGLTVAGLLMFGLEESIKSAEGAPQFHLDYREHLGEDSMQRWSDRVTIDGTWEGNLFQFYGRVLPKLAATLKAPFQLDSSLYRYDESSVAAALREAVVNALIHGDYVGQGGVVIDRWADRIELSNPGTLPLSHEQLLRGGISECRNKSLQLMFQLMGAGDKAGSGLDKIRSSWAGARLRDPRLQETQRPHRVRLSLPMVSILPGDCIEELRLRFGAQLDALRPEDIQILVMALEEGDVTNLRLQEVLTLHRTDLTRILQQLVRNKFLDRQGFGRWTRYVLPEGAENMGNPARGAEGFVSSNTDTSTVSSTDTSTDTSADTSDTANHSDRSTGTLSRGRDDDLRPLQERNSQLWENLWLKSQTIRSRPRMSARELQHASMDLYKLASWLTRNELALLLGRNSENIRDSVINPLLAEGVLETRFASRNHPQQAYGLFSSDREVA